MDVNPGSVADPYVRERILNLALEVSAATSLNQILTRALARVDELLPFDLTSVAMVDEDSGELLVQEMNYRKPGQGGTRSLVGRRIAMDDSNVFGWVAGTGRPHLQRTLEDPFPFQQLQDSEPLASHIIVPLIGYQDVLGILSIGSFQADRYDEIDMAMAAQFARLIGLAVINLRVHHQVTELALRDGLTGAYNHRQFQDVLTHELGRLGRYGGELSLMLLDVDNFKSFNDRFGHPAGDQVLKQTVRLIKKSLRRADLVFRYGGEEFAVLLPETAVGNACRVAEKLNAKLRTENIYKAPDGVELPVTVSIGLADAVESHLSREELIERADRALYQAKQAGKDRAVLFQPSSD
jgi:diguanylate cyclase (GGDEF)-like protein